MNIMDKINVEIVYALSYKQVILFVELKFGVTVKEAIFYSGILDICSDVDLFYNKVGIYGELVKLTDIVNDGDRIEIYRPLITNPKMVRDNRIMKLKK